jgi:VWFA-related protein
MTSLSRAALCACASTMVLQQQPFFRMDVNTIAVYATVRDASGHLVPNLTKDDFTVTDDRQPADIVVFSNDPVPITVALMLDMSESMAGDYLQVRAAARAFVDELWEGDRATIGTFGAEVAVSPHLTSNKTTLKRIADEEVWPGGGTPLWSGLRAAMTALTGQPGRRVVLALTDGGEACPAPGYDRVPAIHSQPPGRIIQTWEPRDALGVCATGSEVERRAMMQEFMVYGVEFHRRRLVSPESVMRLHDIIDETGGGRFQLDTNADLAATFARVVEELHHQYTIGFVPHTLDGKEHRVDLRAKNPQLRARARKSYVAPIKS